MESGAHEKFIFAADSDGERMRWLHAIRENVKASEAKASKSSATPAMLPSAPSSGASFMSSPAGTPRTGGGMSPRGSTSIGKSLRNSSIISSKMLSSCAKMPVSEEVSASVTEKSTKSPRAGGEASKTPDLD